MEEAFNLITTVRLTSPAYCGLADPQKADDTFAAAEVVDHLGNYTTEMWQILTDVVQCEWFSLRLPPSRVPWRGPVYVPQHSELIYSLDRSTARQLRHSIHERYLSLNREHPEISVFSGYGLAIPNDLVREREGLEFLARQAEHFRSLEDHLFIVQSVYPSEQMPAE